MQDGRSARIHANDGAAIGLIRAVRVLVLRRISQGEQGGCGLHQQCRHRQLGSQRVQFVQIVRQCSFALHAQRHFQAFCSDKRIAITVTAHPVPHAEKWFDAFTRQQLFQRFVEIRNFLQEGGAVIG